MTKLQRNQSAQIRSKTTPQPKAMEPQKYDLTKKYRPRTFNQIVGQPEATQTLQAAFETGNLPPSILFAGPSGVGKTSLARLVAAGLNCEFGPTATPCGECKLCRSTLSGKLPGLYTMPAPSITAKYAEQLNAQSQFRVSMLGARSDVFLIEDADRLPKDVDTRLLQLIEEPPAHWQIILTTILRKDVARAIQSRTWNFELKRVAEEDIIHHLEKMAEFEEIQLKPDAANRIAQESYGSVRDALKLLERHRVSEIGNRGSK